MDAVSITDVHKSFPGHWGRGGVYAVKGVSLQIPQGGVYGLIGPNGSGKSTIMKALVGLLSPDAGHCRVFGLPATAAATRREIGFLPENPYFYIYNAILSRSTVFEFKEVSPKEAERKSLLYSKT